MGRFLSIALALAALGACSKDKDSKGLPPAQEWSASTGNLPPAQQSANPHTANPHVAEGDNPHAGVDMDNPHAGMDPSNPHGGGQDVGQMGLPPPDPNRKIDPTHHVKGVIKIHAKAKSKVAAGTPVFLVVKRAGADGQPSGPPLAVEKLAWGAKDEIPFEVSEANAMIAGTELTGDVVVTARYDQDGDALSKQPGDVVGTLRVKIPADKVTVTLDDVLP
jgi:hypothetical protein